MSDICARYAEENTREALSGSARILSTLLGNLAREDTPKFRRVNLQNAKIQQSVAARHAMAVLEAAGFESVEGGAAMESKLPGDQASARAAQLAAALDTALSACANASFALRLSLPHGGAGVRACAYADEGRTLLTGATDNLVRVWPSAPPLGGDPAPCAVLAAHESVRGTAGVQALLPLPGGEVASAGRDGKVCVWDASDTAGRGAVQPAPLAVLRGHGDGRGQEVSNKTNIVALSHAGRLVSAGWDRTARVWPPRAAGSPAGGEGECFPCAFGPQRYSAMPTMVQSSANTMSQSVSLIMSARRSIRLIRLDERVRTDSISFCVWTAPVSCSRCTPRVSMMSAPTCCVSATVRCVSFSCCRPRVPAPGTASRGCGSIDVAAGMA
mmetsp:Transcript_41205/g.134101  ORF Transcript_41205/g.134101 Transcript_41205/m.134101 type:complete len:385 (-) Transcript_41205:78-1232(-)